VVLQQGAWPCTPALDERVKQVLVQSRSYDELLRTEHLLLLCARYIGPSAHRSGAVASRQGSVGLPSPVFLGEHLAAVDK
jgi:hypothetical protein